MSNLIPTPRTDKNGVTTIRHMKPEQSLSPATTAALASAAPVARSATENASNKRVIGMLNNTFKIPEESLDICLDYMRADDEELVPMAVRLMTTGNEHSRRMAHNNFYQAIRKMNDSRLEEHDNEFWHEQCLGSWGNILKPELAMVWAVGEVLEETETSSTSWATLRTSSSYFNNELMLAAGNPNDYSPTSLEYWRGVAALALANELEKGTKDEWRGFVEYAGTHDDLKLLVDTAKERGTVNVENLKGILEQTDISSSLREGIL